MIDIKNKPLNEKDQFLSNLKYFCIGYISVFMFFVFAFLVFSLVMLLLL